ncbi:MAG: autotransporter domain-containing protein, partial [Phascolarctobacterium sp.]|nr:autotransporter domain-containing protein [Candidatus Phascolarctobacterium caballi]
FNSDISTDADNLANAGKKTINSGKTLTFIDGVVADKLEGAGNLKFATDMSVDADNLANTGTNTVESGKKVTFTSGKIRQNWDGAGTAEFNNTVSVTDGVNLGTATNNVNGTLDVAGNITANNINFKSGSTLKVDGSKITSTPAISGLTSASVESGAKLYIANAEKETEYKILDGSNLDVQSWTTDETATGINASYGLQVDTVTNDGSVFNITFKENTQATGSSDIKNILVNLPAGGKVKEWVDNISTSQEDMKIQSNTINTMANMAQLANVQHGTYEINNFATENIFESMSSEHIPIIEHERPKLENIDASDGKAEIITIPTGQMQEELTREETQQNYEKRVLATIIHSKEKIDGMETGHLEQNSTLQYNGTTVGADLWSGKHGFGGVAVTYADGNFASSQEVSNVKNDADFYGINVYNRQDIKKVSIQYDIGYTHTDNDVKMHTLGAEEVTAKPKVDAYSAGVKLEQPIKIGKMAKFIPFIGARYMFLKSKNYTNNLGLGYDTDDQHLFKIPIGLTLKGDYQTDEGWLLSTLISAGYTWNLGDRDGKQNVSYGGYSDIIDYSIADKGEYFVRAAIQAAYEKLLFELGYRYTKGKTTRDNKWYLNMNCEF